MEKIRKIGFSGIILLMSLLLIGGFHEYISCALSAAMCIWLLVRFGKGKNLQIRKDFLTSAVVAVCGGYGLTCIWGIDRGMALIGFVKFLPLILYLFCLQQEDDLQPTLDVLPWFGAVLAILSAVGMQIPGVEALFAVAGRLAGTFQYPNTFAIFLLVCELLLLKKPGKKIWDYCLLAVLIGCFLYTGSRTAFVVALIANVAMLLSMTQKKVRLIALGVMGGICLVGVVLALNPNSVLNRYLTISLTESTFVGRVLYWVDALPLLAKHPLGMGYSGYYYAQQSIQSGVYSVRYIHNDLLQLVLDIGIVPAGLFVTAIILWLCRKTVPVADKIIVGAVCLHSLFDFNMQFVGVFFLLLLLLSTEKCPKVMQAKPRLTGKIALVAVAVVSLYLGSALMLSHFGKTELSDKIYPYNTQNKLSMLETETDLEKANALAEEILAQNTQFFAPYSIRGKYTYSKGDFGAMIQNERAALERNPFNQSEYEAYCKMLITGIDLYVKNGDSSSAKICQQELLAVYQQFTQLPDRLSALGKMIKDQPVTELSSEIVEYVKTIGG